MTVELADLSAFRDVADNWSIAGSVFSNYLSEKDISTSEGTGILVNQPSEQAKDNLATQFEHGDLEIQFDVMMPKGSNSGVYFQGRYEVQLFDSWMVPQPTYADIGGIYQRWDDRRSKGSEGYEGVSPNLNAGKAPGLWQHFHILFRAPQFDTAGGKLKNAKFEFVRLNGILIHENVEVSGPTRAHQLDGEVPIAPLYLQGDHGPAAFRNISYKAYNQDTLTLTDLSYEVFQGKYDFIPNFDTLKMISSGRASDLDVKALTDLSEGYCILFKGVLNVAQTGEYLFETDIDDGGDLWIDSILTVHNQGEPGGGIARGKVNLTKGAHAFKMTYYQEVWNASLKVQYEGPGIHKRPLASTIPPKGGEQERTSIKINDVESPTLLRGFVMYGNEKLTHTISVADPLGIHYSYDLLNGNLVKCWRGPFGDVTEMWHGRGASQLHQPLVTTILLSRGNSFAQLTDQNSGWPSNDPEDLIYKGYRIDDDHRPIFLYDFDGFKIEDQMVPEGTHLSRNIRLAKSPDKQELYFRVASAKKIIQLKNGLYSVDGEYYINAPNGGAYVRTISDHQELISKIEGSVFTYSLLW
jgi:hypothetical protein